MAVTGRGASDTTERIRDPVTTTSSMSWASAGTEVAAPAAAKVPKATDHTESLKSFFGH